MVASSSTDGKPVITTRRAWKIQQQEDGQLQSPVFQEADSTATTPCSSDTAVVTVVRKRKEPHHPSVPSVKPRKKSRSPPPVHIPKPPRIGRPPKKRDLSLLPSLPSSRQSSRPRTLASSPEPEPPSRSRSVSTFTPVEIPISRPCAIREDGKPGPGFLSNEDIVWKLMESDRHYYKGFFKNLDDPSDKSFEPQSYPVMDLEFPNSHASERVPTFDRAIDRFTDYLTPAQQSLFGTIPTATLSHLTQDPDSDSSSSSTSSPSRPRACGMTPSSSMSSLSGQPKSNHLRQVQRAIHRQDGPLFMRTMNTINSLLRSLKYPPLPEDIFEDVACNGLTAAVASWKNVPKDVRGRVYEETYQRCVGPNAMKLEKSYKVWSNEVYGELLPPLLSDIFNATGLGPNSLFMDLGSGVGNAVLQASLSTGCTSYGIEVGKFPSELARAQLEQMKKRCRMWGFSMGEVELEEGDMLKSERMTEMMKKADVVLINNKVFAQTLNEAIRASFLDLKEGAIVVSLATFWDTNKNITERNVNDMSAIFQVSQRTYRSGSVSWGNGGGQYYIHRVDREGYRKKQERIESSSARSGRYRGSAR
ncbi:hypothetical protein HWV62_38526 [Athelia sp. TMB]|nr:hypothetical protein HWV62_38526 [Athelia sp. TMB]